MKNEFAKNTAGWKIRTSKGFVSFAGVAEMGAKQLYEIQFDDGTTVHATATHMFFTTDGREIMVREMSAGLTLMGVTDKTITSICRGSIDLTYDIIESETHTFFANGLLSHNCQFISSDPLLINTLVLQDLTARTKHNKPHAITGDITFWKEPLPNTTYLVGVDPATGSGNDFTTFIALEFPSMEQVAEFRSNTMSSPKAYQALKRMLKVFEKLQSTTYFSVENNGVGEGIIALLEADENPPAGEFISEEGKNRKGMNTNGKTKIKACLNLKEMLERGTLRLSSPLLVAELKNYIRRAGSYSAKLGATDDLISGLLIAIRLLEEISTFEQEAYDTVYSESHFDETEGGQWDQEDSPDFVVF